MLGMEKKHYIANKGYKQTSVHMLPWQVGAECILQSSLASCAAECI